MSFLNNLCIQVNRGLTAAAGVCLVSMIALTCGNIFLRLVWGPIPGAVELTGYFSAVLAAFSLGHTQMRRGHIAVDLLLMAFPRPMQKAMGILNDTLCLCFFLLITWQVTERATVLKNTGELSETLQIIYYPFIYCTALGCLALCLVLIRDILQNLIPQQEQPS
jgi:TRAP-type C4-dicarboxylate transport system permease small subunit